MEFACAAAGAKLVAVMGHTACGAVAGAINGVELGNLTGLLAKIQPAIRDTAYDGDRTGKNAEFVDAVARTNVAMAVKQIRERSPVLRELEEKGTIKIVGSMYDIGTGRVALLA
jgi:carbonic anhydrase